MDDARFFVPLIVDAALPLDKLLILSVTPADSPSEE
jgi:hypothetical protein